MVAGAYQSDGDTGTPGSGSNTGQASHSADDDVVDAEFQEVA